MSLLALVKPFAWSRYSKKLAGRIEKPRWCGAFTENEQRQGIRRVIGTDGEVESGNAVCLYWLVDESDGVIADAAFCVFGQSALIGAADAACELARGKSYAQASRIGADLIDRHLRDVASKPSFPPETSPHLNLVVGAIGEAAQACGDIVLREPLTPAPLDIGERREGGYPGFDSMSTGERLAVIEQIVAEEIRPFIELDAGGITIVGLEKGLELTIAYEGACTTCYSATGMTLSYIQDLLRARVHPDMVVIPDMASLQG